MSETLTPAIDELRETPVPNGGHEEYSSVVRCCAAILELEARLAKVERIERQLNSLAEQESRHA